MNLDLKSSPKSFVGLLAVDKSVLLRKTGNDVDKNRIHELLRYEPSLDYKPLKVEGSESIYEEFGGLSSFILTDALSSPRKEKISSRFDDYYSDSEEDYVEFFDTDEADLIESAMEEDRVRKYFPETWFFDSFSVDANGHHQLPKQAPDTITSWVITGFSLDQENGLGLSEPQSLFVRQSLFIKLNLPYSIRTGEILKVDVTVFNYIPNRKINLGVEVEMFTDQYDPEFEFIDYRSKCIYEVSSDTSRKTLISVAPNSMSSTSLFIRPLKEGKIKLNVKATGQQAKIMDAVEGELLVENEGITKYVNNPVMIDLSKQSSITNAYHFLPREDIIPKSLRFGIALDADLMGNVLMDVQSLM